MNLKLAPRQAALLLLAARLRVDARMRAAIFNSDEARDEHGRWTDEGGFMSSPSDALTELGNGDKATVSKEDVRATVEKAFEKGTGPIDLTNLSVEGTPLFVGGLNRARNTMPQIPNEHQAAFLASLREKHVTVTEGLVDPTSLLPTQSEINAVRVGEKIHKYDEERKTMRPIMVSKDDYVLDGHHRWATAVVVAFDSPKAGVKIPVIRIGAKHERALDLMLDYTKANKISNRALASRPESAIHAAADKHQNAMTVAVMYAFLKGRKAYKSSGADAAVEAIHDALLVSLPPVLLKVVAAGGEVGLAKLKTRRAAGSPDQPRDEHGRWVGGAGSVISRSSSAENTAAFHAAIDALPSKVKEEIKNTVIQLVPSVEAFGHSHSAGVVEGAQNAEGILIKEGPRQTTSLYHEIGHKTSNFLADRQPFKDAVAKDTAKKLSGQMAYFGSSPREAIAQSFAYHMGAKDSDRAKFEKTFKHTHNLLGEHLRKFGRLPTVASFHALLTSTTTAEERALAGSFNIRFDVSSPEAIAWAREHAGELAKDLSATSEQAIRDAVAAALEGDGVDAAYDDILAAVGDEARAELIARTEVMTAANEGQREGWDQAVREGLLTGDEQRVWIATSDACPLCEELDGETTGLDEGYPNDGGDGPPLHPNCRCTEGIQSA